MMKQPAYRKKVVSTTKGKITYAVVRLNGKDHILGKYGTKASKDHYDRLLGEYLSAGRTTQDQEKVVTVTEVCIDYAKACKLKYRDRNGQPSSEYQTVQRILRDLRRLYGPSNAAEFKALKFKAFRDELIRQDISRYVTNKYCEHVISAFKLAAENEKIGPDNYQSMKAVARLKKGQTNARETSPIGPIPEESIEKTIEFLPKIVADMVRIQLLTGMRPGEVCQLRPVDIDRSEDIWLFVPEHHKNEHRDQERIVCLGIQAQQILKPYLFRSDETFCFVPSETVEQVRRNRHLERVTPEGQGNRVGANRKRGKKRRCPGKQYTTNAYRRAIHRACDQAEIDRWSPNRIRKTAGTKIRNEFQNLEAAQAVLGHKSKSTTERFYAEIDISLAVEVAKKIG